MVAGDPFQWLSDLQLGDEKVTLNHLVCVSSQKTSIALLRKGLVSQGAFF